MKKIVSLILACIFTLSLCACGGAKEVNAPGANKLVYGEKYIRHDYVGNEHSTVYIVFIDDRYVDYTVDGSKNGNSHYTIRCRYEVMDEGVLCMMFDSIKVYDDGKPLSVINEYSDFYKTLMFSENNLVDSTNGNLYIRESFAKNELPNFGKPIE